MRFLDTREQKSPRFLVDAFPDIEIKPLTVGDYFSGYISVIFGDKMYHGNLVEIKIGKDFGIHTEQLERFQDELYRMSCYRQKNPHVQLHAVWHRDVHDSDFDQASKLFYHLCFKYHVWGHITDYNFTASEYQLVELLKGLDQDSKYKEFAPYLKRSHEEPTFFSKMIRQIDGVATDKAIDSSKTMTRQEYNEAFGLKKDGTPKKIALKSFRMLTEFAFWITMLETGESP